MPDPVPRRDVDLVSFSAAFTAGVSEFAPSFNIPPELISQLQAAQQAYAQAYQTAASPGTDSTTAIRAKIDARKALLRVLRPIAGWARAMATDEQRARMRLKPRRRGKAPPLPRPESAPRLTLRRVEGRTLHMDIRDVSGRAKPRGIRTAVLFTAVGESAPEKIDEWQFRGMTCRRHFAIDFAAQIPPGTRVWVMARWENPRCQTGPLCRPIYAHLGFGVEQGRSMRRASSILPPGNMKVPSPKAQEPAALPAKIAA